MAAILLNDPPEARDRQRTALAAGIVLSLLLHAAVMLSLLDLKLRTASEPRHDIVVEMVPPPEPQPQPAEPPPPAPPQPIAREMPPPTPAPVFNDGKIADKSTPPAPRRTPPTRVTPPKATTPPPPPPPTATQPAAAEVEIVTTAPPSPTPRSGGERIEATQAFRDFILQQIVSRWELDVHGPRYRHIELMGPPIVVLPDGFLEPPWGKDEPWNPQRLIGNYDKLAQDEQTALVTFVQALRQAQPFRLPADDSGNGQSRVFQLHFKLGDLPR